jgi:hypothetical protein
MISNSLIGKNRPAVPHPLAARAYLPSPPFRGEREGPIAGQWEGEVGAVEHSGFPHLTLPSPPPGAQRENQGCRSSSPGSGGKP